MICIELSYGQNWERLEFNKERITIGRGNQCDLVLKGMGISREHAYLFKKGDALFIKDNDSKNGTYVKGTRISKQKVKPEDVVEIGTCLIRICPPDTFKIADTSTYVKDIRELTNSRKDVLDIFEDIGHLLVGEDQIEQVALKILEIIKSKLMFTRATILLWDEKTESLESVAIWPEKSQLETVKAFSSTIVERVFREKVGILTTNAMVDPRFTGKESIMIQGIRSAICAPLWNRERTIGVIYMDSLLKDNNYSAEDLKILSILASFAAIGIEQVKLGKRIRDEQKVRQWLSRYHSPAVVQRLVDGDQTGEYRLKVEEREVSVLFCDIVGFTPLSGRLKPVEVASLLNFFFSKMTDIIFDSRGTLDKFIGDCIMAIFGAPDTMENHADSAVRCAINMQKKVYEINRELPEDRQLQIRIGINSGHVVAGDIGSKKRMEYTVLGDTVNIASRLESYVSSPGEITIGDRTRQLLSEEFKCDEIKNVQIKGVEKPIDVYKIIWEEDK